MLDTYRFCASCIHYERDKVTKQELCSRLGYNTKSNFSFNCWTPKPTVIALILTRAFQSKEGVSEMRHEIKYLLETMEDPEIICRFIARLSHSDLNQLLEDIENLADNHKQRWVDCYNKVMSDNA